MIREGAVEPLELEVPREGQAVPWYDRSRLALHRFNNRSSVNYPALTDGASRFIDTLTPGILAKYSIPHRRGVFIPGRLPYVP